MTTTKRTTRPGSGAPGRTPSRAIAPATSWTLGHIAEPGRKQSQGRRIVVVLGTHCSGASLLAKILHYLGVDMADEADDVGADGSGGPWERAALNAIQDEIFETIGRPIGSPAHSLPFPAGWWRRKAVQKTKRKLVGFLREQLQGSSRLWGFKDPRTCRLLPLWHEAFAELDLSPSYVLALNEPASAAVSMAAGGDKAPKVTAVEGELMWLAYNFDVVRYLSADGMTIVNYDDWLDLGPDIARALADKLELPTVYPQSELERVVEDIVQDVHRRQDDGKRRARAALPISAPFFRTLHAISKTGAPDLALLDRQAATINLIFDCLSPTTNAMAKSLTEQSQAISAREEELTKQQARSANALDDHREKLDEARHELGRMRDDLAAVAESRDRSASENDALKREIAEYRSAEAAERSRLAGRIRASEEEGATAAAALAKTQSDLALAMKGREEARIRLAAALAAQQEAQSKLCDAAAENSHILAALAAKDQALAQLDAESAPGKAALSEAMSRLKKLEARVASSTVETQQVGRMASALARERDSLAAQRTSMEQDLGRLEGVADNLNERLAESAKETKEARESLAETRRELASLQAAKETADASMLRWRQECDVAVQAAKSQEVLLAGEIAKVATAMATIEELNRKLATQRETLRREREAAAEAMAAALRSQTGRLAEPVANS